MQCADAAIKHEQSFVFDNNAPTVVLASCADSCASPLSFPLVPSFPAPIFPLARYLSGTLTLTGIDYTIGLHKQTRSQELPSAYIQPQGASGSSFSTSPSFSEHIFSLSCFWELIVNVQELPGAYKLPNRQSAAVHARKHYSSYTTLIHSLSN